MKEEDESFTIGIVSYYMTLIWFGIGLQAFSMGVVGLIFFGVFLILKCH